MNVAQEQGSLSADIAGGRSAEYRFFDPATPPRPENVLGLDTDAVMMLGRHVIQLSKRSSVGRVEAFNTMDSVVRLLPLLEKIQSGEEVVSEDVRPYRKAIKFANPTLLATDRMALAASAIGLGVPFRRFLNGRIEKDFPILAKQALEKARQKHKTYKSDLEHVTKFDKPREQFEIEVNKLARFTTASIREQWEWRIGNGLPEYAGDMTPTGIVGFFVRAARRARSLLKRQPRVNPEVTAYDAGFGIERAFEALKADHEETARQYPLLSKLIFEKMSDKMPVGGNEIAFLAPEILTALYSFETENKCGDALIESVKRNPRIFRSRFESSEHFQRIAPSITVLLPVIRNVLPATREEALVVNERMAALLEGETDR